MFKHFNEGWDDVAWFVLDWYGGFGVVDIGAAYG